MEKTNFRYMKPEDLQTDPATGAPEQPDFASVDVSFISLSRILPPALEILRPGAQMVCLIKPQFEAGREKVGKKGVVRDRAVHEEVIENVTEMTAGLGFAILGLAYSPIRGPEGNIEYLMYIEKPGGEGPTGGIEPGALQETIRRLVDDSHITMFAVARRLAMADDDKLDIAVLAGTVGRKRRFGFLISILTYHLLALALLGHHVFQGGEEALVLNGSTHCDAEPRVIQSPEVLATADDVTTFQHLVV